MNILQTNAPKWQNANSPSMTFMLGDSALGDSAPKGQGAISPGQRPGIRVGHRHTPCKGKSLVMHIMLLPLQGANHNADIPRALPWAKCRLPLQGASEVFALLSDGANCRLPLRGASGLFALSDGANCRLIRYLHDLN